MAQISPASEELLPPVFILASRGAGGSFLAQLLGGHPELHAAPHLNVLSFETSFQHQIYARASRELAIHGLWRFLAEELMGEQTIQSVQTARRWLAQREHLTASILYAELQALVPQARLVDYSPFYALGPQAMARVSVAIPHAQILHLVSHPERQAKTLSLAIAQALRASTGHWRERGLDHPCLDMQEVGDHFIDWSVTPPVFDPQFSWYRTQRAAATLSENLPEDRYLQVSLEQIQAAPADAVNGILTFLGCDRDTSPVRAMLENTSTTYTRMGPFDAHGGVDHDMLDLSVKGWLAHAFPESGLMADQPLPWRGDGDRWQPKLVELAKGFGYALAQEK